MVVEADNLCNDGKTLQDYMRHIEQQSHGRKTLAESCDSFYNPFTNRASLLRVHRKLKDIRTNVPALHCDNLDCG